MINGDPHDFIETVSSGQDVSFSFHGKKYWCQAYNKNGECYMEVAKCFSPYDYLWEFDDADNLKCGEAFQKAPIFDGKTFWEVEGKIEWLDE